MHLENFIQFIIRHNALLIQSLVGLIVICVLYLAYRSFLAAKEAELHPDLSSPSLGNLEETLKKLLEKANTVPAGGSAEAAAAGPESAALAAEISELKKSLEAKQTEIETLKTAAPVAAADGAGAVAAAAPAVAGMSSEEKTALENQLRELQAKLAEYEIISEDIADLSFYKEENTKLQKELEGLKAGGAVAAPAAPAASQTPAPEPVSAPAAPPAPEPVPEPTPAPVAAAPAPEPVPAPVAPAEPMAPSPELSELTPIPTTSTQADPVADADIMKEFEMAVEEQQAQATPAASAAPAAPAAEAAVDLGTMDMDKMLAEASGLDVTKSDEAVNALEASTDAEKLIAEAATMEGGVKADDADLMGQFENFVKKGG